MDGKRVTRNLLYFPHQKTDGYLDNRERKNEINFEKM